MTLALTSFGSRRAPNWQSCRFVMRHIPVPRPLGHSSCVQICLRQICDSNRLRPMHAAHPCAAPSGRRHFVPSCKLAVLPICLALAVLGSVDSVHPAPRPSGTLASLLYPNRLPCRFVALPSVTAWPPHVRFARAPSEAFCGTTTSAALARVAT